MKQETLITGFVFVFIIACQSSCKNRTPESNIIFKDASGHTLTKDDLANVTGEVYYEIVNNEPVDNRAKILHNHANTYGQEGKYDIAIAILEEAIKIEPRWAYLPYDLAYTYLLKGNADSALKYYRKTDELAPKGFFTSKTALYTLEGEQSGKFPKDLYLSYLQIEWIGDTITRLQFVKDIIKKVPDYAPAWKELSVLLDDSKDRLAAIEQGLSKSPDADTKGVLLINKAMALNEAGKKEEAIQILGALIFSSGATAGNIAIAKYSLKSITESGQTP